MPLDRAAQVILIRGPLTALHQANVTGNYGVLRDLGGPSFRVNTSAGLAALFEPVRSRSLDLAQVLVHEPVVIRGPLLDEQGRLRLTGFFPLPSYQLVFDIAYEPAEGEWKLFGLAVSAEA
ncbi:MAG: hypothetical protein ACK4FB_11795 [Brevundimonas sp.]|uniref:hypothetical protein n=1 Tax=Brevundimonas sp. TaxID=1871086 RepID=UPI00391887C6